MDENLTPAVEAMQYNSIKPNKPYFHQKNLYLPRSKSLVVMLNPSMESTIQIMNGGYAFFYKCGYRRFSTPTKYDFKIAAKMFKKNMYTFKRQAYMKQAKNKMIKFSQTPNGDGSLIYDLSDEMTVYDKFKRKRAPKVACKEYAQFLSTILPKDDSYENKFIYISLAEWAREGHIIGITKENLSHPFSVILRAMYFKQADVIDLIKDYKILLVNEKAEEYMIVDLSQYTKKTANQLYTKFRMGLRKMHIVVQSTMLTDEGEELPVEVKTEKEERLETVQKKAVSRELIKRFTGKEIETANEDNAVDVGSSEANIIEDEIYDADVIDGDFTEEISDVINTIIEGNPELAEKSVDDLEPIIDKEIKKQVYASKFMPERTEKELKNILQLESTQKQIVEQPVDVLKSKIIDTTSFEGVVKTSNKHILESKYVNLEKNYAKKRYKYDVDKAVAGLSNGETKVFIKNRTEVDSSDQFNQKTTVTYELEDEHGRNYTIKLDIPRLIDGNYIWVGGSKKLIGKQRLFKPIAKTGPDTVQIVTFYNKCFITRHGTNLDSTTTSLVSYLKSHGKKYDIVFGNAKVSNAKYNTSLEFDTFSKNIVKMTIPENAERGPIYINFDLKKLEQEIINMNDDELGDFNPDEFDTPEGHVFGYYKKKYDESYTFLRTVNWSEEQEEDGIEFLFTDSIMNLLPEKDVEDFRSAKTGSGRQMYARMRVMSKYIPVILFLLFCDGWTETMRKCNIKWETYDSMREFKKAHEADSLKWNTVVTSDKVIAYPNSPTENALLLNGIKLLPIKNYTLEELDSKDTFIDMLTLFYSSSTMAFNLAQFRDFMIDEKSKEILMDFGLPTDFCQLLFHACKLLKNNQYLPENNLNNMRIRSSEIISQIVYQSLTTAYGNYRKTAHKKRPARISVPQDIVIKSLMSTSLVSDALVLNPYLELENERECTIKASVSTPPGKPKITLTGTNRVDGYGMDKRAFDVSMSGIFGITSSADANVGIHRHLTLEPSITSTNGYFDCVSKREDLRDMNCAQLMTPAELTTPTMLYDDPQRTSMMRGQTAKMLLCNDMSPALMGNRTEDVLPYHVSDTFCFKAKQSGKVIDMKDGIYVVQYKDGTYESFNTNTRVFKSTDGQVCEVTLTPEIKVGQTFKEKQILATDPRAFKKHRGGIGASTTIGVLAKVALSSSYDIYEDSEPISQNLAERMAVDAIEKKDAVLAKDTYVEKIVKIGDHVGIGDPLIVFDPDSGDPEIAKFLKSYSTGGGINEALVQTGKSIIKAPISGEVTEIEIWRSVDIEELSESLAKIVKDYNKRIDSESKFLNKYKNPGDNDYMKCGQILNHTTEKVQGSFGKIMGIQVDDGVLIRIHIKHRDVIKKGDKVANFSAMKAVTSHVVPRGQEAYSEFRPDEPLDAIVAPLAISARKTEGLFKFLWGNKVLIEGKRKLIADFDAD